MYALLTSKSQEHYEELFASIIRKCEELQFTPDPLKVITDFEQSVIRAIQTVFGAHVTIQGCFYHLTQSTWRKVQQLGLTEMYRSNDDIKLFCGMIDALAFLPVSEVIDGMAHLKT